VAFYGDPNLMKKNIIRIVLCGCTILFISLYLFFAWPTRAIFWSKSARLLDPEGKYGPFDLWSCLSSDTMTPIFKFWCCFAVFGGFVAFALALLSLLFAFLKKKSLFFTFPLIALCLVIGFLASFALTETGELDFGYGAPRFLIPLLAASLSAGIAEYFAWKKPFPEFPY